METLTFLAIQAFCAIVLIWYIANENAGAKGEKGLLGLVRGADLKGFLPGETFRKKDRVGSDEDRRVAGFRQRSTKAMRKETMRMKTGKASARRQHKLKAVKPKKSRTALERDAMNIKDVHAIRRVPLKTYNDDGALREVEQGPGSKEAQEEGVSKRRYRRKQSKRPSR